MRRWVQERAARRKEREDRMNEAQARKRRMRELEAEVAALEKTVAASLAEIRATAEESDVASARRLLSMKASPDATNKDKQTPLYAACKAGCGELALLLVLCVRVAGRLEGGEAAHVAGDGRRQLERRFDSIRVSHFVRMAGCCCCGGGGLLL